MAFTDAIVSRSLVAGAAQKLSGRLAWATQYVFHRLGRAMIRPIFDQKFSRTGEVHEDLMCALRWWGAVILHGIAEARLWDAPTSPVASLFVDARGSPARIAAVLFINGQILYTDGKPSEAHMGHLVARADNQITALEIMSIGLGLSTFVELLAGRKVVVYSDNRGAEVCGAACVLLLLLLFLCANPMNLRLAGVNKKGNLQGL